MAWAVGESDIQVVDNGLDLVKSLSQYFVDYEVLTSTLIRTGPEILEVNVDIVNMGRLPGVLFGEERQNYADRHFEHIIDDKKVWM